MAQTTVKTDSIKKILKSAEKEKLHDQELNKRIRQLLGEENKKLHEIYTDVLKDYAYLWEKVDDIEKLREMMITIIKMFLEEHRDLEDLSNIDKAGLKQHINAILEGGDALIPAKKNDLKKVIEGKSVQQWFKEFTQLTGNLQKFIAERENTAGSEITKEELSNLFQQTPDAGLVSALKAKVGLEFLSGLAEEIKNLKIDTQQLEAFISDVQTMVNKDIAARKQFSVQDLHETAQKYKINRQSGDSAQTLLLIEKRVDQILDQTKTLHRVYQHMIDKIPIFFKSKHWAAAQKSMEQAADTIFTKSYALADPTWAAFAPAMRKMMSEFENNEKLLNKDLDKWKDSFQGEIDHHLWLYIIYKGIHESAMKLRSNTDTVSHLEICNELRNWTMVLLQWRDRAEALYINNESALKLISPRTDMGRIVNDMMAMVSSSFQEQLKDTKNAYDFISISLKEVAAISDSLSKLCMLVRSDTQTGGVDITVVGPLERRLEELQTKKKNTEQRIELISQTVTEIEGLISTFSMRDRANINPQFIDRGVTALGKIGADRNLVQRFQFVCGKLSRTTEDDLKKEGGEIEKIRQDILKEASAALEKTKQNPDKRAISGFIAGISTLQVGTEVRPKYITDTVKTLSATGLASIIPKFQELCQKVQAMRSDEGRNIDPSDAIQSITSDISKLSSARRNESDKLKSELDALNLEISNLETRISNEKKGISLPEEDKETDKDKKKKPGK